MRLGDRTKLKETMAQPKTTGIFSRRLTAGLKATYEELTGERIGDLSGELARIAIARILEALGDRDREPWRIADRKLLMALEAIAEEGDPDVTEEYIKKIRHKLMGLDEEGLANLADKLARVAASIGDSHTKQLEICKATFTKILMLRDRPSTEIILSALKQMLLDAGLDPLDHERILDGVQAKKIPPDNKEAVITKD